MFGTHLVGPSLMLNFAMRWPLLVPAVLIGAVTASVVQSPDAHAPQLALVPPALPSGLADAGLPKLPATDHAAFKTDASGLEASFTQTMGAAADSFEAFPDMPTPPLVQPPQAPRMASRAARLPQVQLAKLRELVVVENVRGEPVAGLQDVPLAQRGEPQLALPSVTDSDSDESPAMRLLIPAP